jgi:hypothetical protein
MCNLWDQNAGQTHEAGCDKKLTYQIKRYRYKTRRSLHHNLPSIEVHRPISGMPYHSSAAFTPIMRGLGYNCRLPAVYKSAPVHE